MFAGTNSGVGKTTITTAVMTALTRQGYRVQPYKVGPDYIDPGYHLAATGRFSRNLDSWFFDADGIKEMFTRSAVDADLSIIEGVMGLYDGYGSGEEGSSAQVAKLLQCPTVLILDARSMARSAAAVVYGYRNYDPKVPLAGVILNRVGSDRHYRILKESVESCGVPVLGAVKRNELLSMPERHLGLVPTAEKNDMEERLDILAATVSASIDLEGLVRLARQAGRLSEPVKKLFPTPKQVHLRIGVARDEAFNFYYQDSLDLLSALGAELVLFSPLHDNHLPPALDGLYLGGGFPEMFLQDLADRKTFLSDIRTAAASGMPVYAECGGFMYLTEAIEDFSGKRLAMAGVVPGCCRMERRRVALGYVRASVLKDNVLSARGTEIKGHEFHYSTYFASEEVLPSPAYLMVKSDGSQESYAGYSVGNILASYLHLHLAAYPDLAENFLKSCAIFRKSRQGE
jgi:cobyrinic acid a,c-diamide synthase